MMGRVYSATTMSLSMSQTIRALAKQKTKRSEHLLGSMGQRWWMLAGLSIRTVREFKVPSAESVTHRINRTKLTHNRNHYKVITRVERVLPTFNAVQTSMTERKSRRLRCYCYLATVEVMPRKSVQKKKGQQVLARIFHEKYTKWLLKRISILTV